MASAKQTGGVTPDAMRYLNRLSDLLYAMARMADAQGPGPAAPRRISAAGFSRGRWSSAGGCSPRRGGKTCG